MACSVRARLPVSRRSRWRHYATCTLPALTRLGACMARRHGYLSELPARKFLPMFWACAERALLQGTESDDEPACRAGTAT